MPGINKPRPAPGVLAKLYLRQRWSVRDLAAHFHVTPKTMLAWMDEAEVVRRPSALVTRPSPPAGDLAAAYASVSMNSLARRYGVSLDTVQRWLIAAAIPIRSREVTDAARSRLAAAALDRYREGATGHEIAAELGVGPRTVCRWIAQQGETLRRTGSRGRTDIPTALIVELHDVEGMSFAAIAEKVGMTKNALHQRYQRYKRRLALDDPATKAAPPGGWDAGRSLDPTPSSRRSGTS